MGRLEKTSLGLLALSALLTVILVYVQLKIRYLEGEVIVAKERLVYSVDIVNKILKNTKLKNSLYSLAGGSYDESGKSYYEGVRVDYYRYYLDPHSASSFTLYERNGSTFALDLSPPTYIFQRDATNKKILSKTGKLVRKTDKELLYTDDGLSKDNTYMIVDYRRFK